MTCIAAEQLVFTRLQPRYSPTRRTGYQSVYASPGLSQVEVKELEDRIKCFGIDRNDTDLCRLQFFHLPGKKIVLTCSQPISHPEIIDKRSGAFVAHCLIIPERDFLKVHNNPFNIFDCYNGFVSEADDLLTRFVNPAEIEPVCQIPITIERPPETDWPQTQLPLLRRLGLEAKSLTDQGKSVWFHGHPDDVADSLRLVFQLLEDVTSGNRKIRLNCTFSTHVDECRVPQGSFWALGGRQRQTQRMARVDTEKQTVLADNFQDDSDKDSSRYLVWLNWAINAHDANKVVRHAGTIQALDQAFLESKSVSDIELSQSAACHEFHTLNPDLAADRIQTFLEEHLPRRLADHIADFVVDCHDSTGLMKIATNPASELGPRKIVNYAARWIRGESSSGQLTLSRREWLALCDLAVQTENWLLMFWSDCLANPGPVRYSRRRARFQALENMNHSTFEKALRLLQNPIHYSSFICPRHLGSLLEHLDFETIRDKEMVSLLEAAVDADVEFTNGDGFTRRVIRMKPRFGKKIRRIITRPRQPDPALLDALDRHQTKQSSRAKHRAVF